MKRIILIISLLWLFTLNSYAQNYCDTLKWKTLKLHYCKFEGGKIYAIDYLDSAVINIDTLSSFFPGISVANISNDFREYSQYRNTR